MIFKNKKINIYHKLVVSITIAAVIPLIILGYFLTTINIDTLHRLIKEYYLSITDNISGKITDEIDIVVQNLNEFSSILGNERISNIQKINLIALKIKRSPLINYILIYDEKGNFLDMLKPKNLSFPFKIKNSLGKEIINSLSKNDKYISEIVYPDKNSYPYIKIIVKWYNKNKLFGYIETYYSLEHLSDTISLASMRKFNKKNLIFIIANNGNIIVHNKKDYVLSRYNLINKEILQNIKNVGDLKKIFRTDLGFSTEFLKDGKKFIGNLQIIPELHSGIVIYQQKAVAFASVKRMIIQIFLWTILAIIFSILIAFILSKVLTTPILKLVDTIKILTTKKKLGLQVNVKSNDEIGELANSFNNMSSELLKYSQQIKESAIVQSKLSRYFSPAIMEQISQTKDVLSMGGVKKNIAVLFVDIHDFTTLSEKLDPKDIAILLNSFFSRSVKNIFKWEGTVDKFIGDCVMAIFNAPYDIDDFVYKAIMAGKEHIDFIKQESDNFKKRFGHDISIGIGIDTGEAIVGNLGSTDRMEYTAIGDVVNTASRIEGKAGKNELLITENCYNVIKDRIECTFLGEFELKGKKAKTKIYVVS